MFDCFDYNCICFVLYFILDLGEFGYSCKLSCEFFVWVKLILSDVKVVLIDMGMYYSYYFLKCWEFDIILRLEISVLILVIESICSLLKL